MQQIQLHIKILYNKNNHSKRMTICFMTTDTPWGIAKQLGLMHHHVRHKQTLHFYLCNIKHLRNKYPHLCSNAATTMNVTKQEW